MGKRVQSLDDLKDSSLLYSKNPPRFMTAIVIVIVVSLIAAIIIADNNKKSEVIHSAGVIQSEDKSYLMSPVSGKIDEIYVEEGQYVEENEKLIKIDVAELDAQLEMYTKLVEYYWSVFEGYAIMEEKIKGYDIQSEVGANFRNQSPFDANSDRIMTMYYESFLKEMSNATADDNRTLLESRQYVIDQALMDCRQIIQQYEPTYKQSLFQKEYVHTLIEKNTIKAETNGIVHFETMFNSGVVVSAGTLLLSISSTTGGNKAVVNLQIPVAYRPYLSEDCIVQMDVVGYPSSTYGKLEGKVTSVSSDSTVDSNGNVWFIIKVTIDEAVLKEKSGPVKVDNGMMVSASIIYGESTWLDWLLKGIGFR